TASPYVTSLAFVDSLLVVSSRPTALHFVAAADPANPTLIASVATGGFPDEFAVRAGALWTTGITGGLYSIALPREPRVTIFPQPVSICPGDDAAFSVFGFSATGPTTFQWR